MGYSVKKLSIGDRSRDGHNQCGHKWQHYKQGVPHIMSSGYKFMVYTEFRFCGKCFTNQTRVAHTTKDEIDWRGCELNLDQLRDKKLKELGI